MLKKSNLAAAIAAAALATAALASPASALPIDQVTLDSPGHEFQFGESGSCAAGVAPGAPAELDWNESANENSIRPEIDGDLCLQSTNAEARVAVVYHELQRLDGHEVHLEPGHRQRRPAERVPRRGHRLARLEDEHRPRAPPGREAQRGRRLDHRHRAEGPVLP